MDTTPPSAPKDVADDADSRPYLGQVLFKSIWEGPDSALRRTLIDRFGDSLCSRWASGSRRPDGDSRAIIEMMTLKTGIPIMSIFWSTRVEMPS